MNSARTLAQIERLTVALLCSHPGRFWPVERFQAGVAGPGLAGKQKLHHPVRGRQPRELRYAGCHARAGMAWRQGACAAALGAAPDVGTGLHHTGQALLRFRRCPGATTSKTAYWTRPRQTIAGGCWMPVAPSTASTTSAGEPGRCRWKRKCPYETSRRF